MTKEAKAITDVRQLTHGDWDEGASISEDAMAVFTRGSRWHQLTPGMKQSIRMITHKIHRIVTGNPSVKDHWDDIGGYAQLVSRRLEDPETPRSVAPEGLVQRPSLRGAMPKPRTATGTRGIVRAGKPFRKKKVAPRAAKVGKRALVRG